MDDKDSLERETARLSRAMSRKDGGVAKKIQPAPASRRPVAEIFSQPSSSSASKPAAYKASQPTADPEAVRRAEEAERRREEERKALEKVDQRIWHDPSNNKAPEPVQAPVRETPKPSASASNHHDNDDDEMSKLEAETKRLVGHMAGGGASHVRVDAHSETVSHTQRPAPTAAPSQPKSAPAPSVQTTSTMHFSYEAKSEPKPATKSEVSYGNSIQIAATPAPSASVVPANSRAMESYYSSFEKDNRSYQSSNDLHYDSTQADAALDRLLAAAGVSSEPGPKPAPAPVAQSAPYDASAELDHVTRDVMSVPRFKPRLIYDEYLPEEQIVSVPLGDSDSDNETVKGETYVVRESSKRKRLKENGDTESTSSSSGSDSDSDHESGPVRTIVAMSARAEEIEAKIDRLRKGIEHRIKPSQAISDVAMFSTAVEKLTILMLSVSDLIHRNSNNVSEDFDYERFASIVAAFVKFLYEYAGSLDAKDKVLASSDKLLQVGQALVRLVGRSRRWSDEHEKILDAWKELTQNISTAMGVLAKSRAQSDRVKGLRNEERHHLHELVVALGQVVAKITEALRIGDDESRQNAVVAFLKLTRAALVGVDEATTGKISGAAKALVQEIEQLGKKDEAPSSPELYKLQKRFNSISQAIGDLAGSD